MLKLNHQNQINCWFYFIFGVFVFKMAIINLESSRNLRIYAQIPLQGLSALVKYRRYSTIGVTYKKWRLPTPTQVWNRQNFPRKFSAH